MGAELQQITSLRDALFYSFGEEKFPERKDLYTNGGQLCLTDYNNIPFETKILNDAESQMGRLLDNSTQPKNAFKEMFYNTPDVFSFVASCDYGCTKGTMYEGDTCPKCGTIIKSISPDAFKFRSMFALPENYPAIIHPAAYNLLKSWLGTKKKKHILESMLLYKSNFPIELKEAGFEFGLTAFQRDFDKIIDYFSTKSKFVSAETYKKSDKIRDIVYENRNNIFIRNIPILNNTLHIITNKKGFKSKKKSTVIGKTGAAYTDSQAEIMAEMLYILDEITLGLMSDRPVNMDAKVFKFAQTYYLYVQEIINKKLAKKKGFIQQNVTAGRFNNTFRGVISPIGHLHDGDEIHIPWKTGVSVLKSEILNLLRSRFGYGFHDSLNKYYRAKEQYDPEIHQIFDSLIAECPYKGLPMLWDRNPSLSTGSEQSPFITKVKTILSDKTISMSQMIVTGFNADQLKTKVSLISNY